jgi:hypothetical protein
MSNVKTTSVTAAGMGVQFQETPALMIRNSILSPRSIALTGMGCYIPGIPAAASRLCEWSKVGPGSSGASAMPMHPRAGSRSEAL